MEKRFLSEGDIKKLKYVKVADPGIDVSHFPDFMIVGPLRTGSTWLYKNLEKHPEIFFSDPKEIHYFYTLTYPDDPLYISDDLSWYMSFFYDTSVTFSNKTQKALNKYKERYEPKVRGEGSATYAILKTEIIKEIVILNPEIKIILMIRNPVDCAWSHTKLRFMMQGGKKYSDIPDQVLEKFFHEDYMIAFGHYTLQIENWSAFLRQDNLFIGYFDDIRSSPEDLLLRIYRFIGVSSDLKYIGHSTHEIINKSESIDIPQRYKEMLKEIFADELKRLKANYGLSWE